MSGQSITTAVLRPAQATVCSLVSTQQWPMSWGYLARGRYFLNRHLLLGKGLP